MDPVVARIGVLLRKHGVTQAELARRTGLGSSHLSKLLGGRRPPRHDTIVRLLDALDITPEEYAAVLNPDDPGVTNEEIEAAVAYCFDHYENSDKGATLLDPRWFIRYANTVVRSVFGVGRADYRQMLGRHALLATLHRDTAIYGLVPDDYRTRAFAGRAAAFQRVHARHQLSEWYLQIEEEIRQVPWAWEIWNGPQSEAHTYVSRQPVLLEREDVGLLRFDGQLNSPALFPKFALVEWTPLDEETEHAVRRFAQDERYAYSHWDALQAD